MYEKLEIEDYTETNKRDYEIHESETGEKYRKGTDKEYRYKRQVAYQRRNPKKRDTSEYHKAYYQKNRDKILEQKKEKYDTKTNTEKCRKYREENKERRREYERQYYEKNMEEKRRQARERYYRRKAEMQSA